MADFIGLALDTTDDIVTGMKRCAVAAVTDAGPVRKRNEDSWGVFAPGSETLHTGLNAFQAVFPLGPEGIVFIVSDGMGGAKAGDFASRAIIEHLHRKMSPRREGRESHVMGLLKEVHRDLIRLSGEDEEKRGMGGTCTLAWLEPDGEVMLVQVGDSRLYRWRPGQLELCSEDQTVAAQLVASGTLEEADARRSRYWHVLTQAIGGGEERPLHPRVSRFKIRSGDWLLLCSDGVTDGLCDPDLLELLREGRPARDIAGSARRILEEALRVAGRDNATVVLVGAS